MKMSYWLQSILPSNKISQIKIFKFSLTKMKIFGFDIKCVNGFGNNIKRFRVDIEVTADRRGDNSPMLYRSRNIEMQIIMSDDTQINI